MGSDGQEYDESYCTTTDNHDPGQPEIGEKPALTRDCPMQDVCVPPDYCDPIAEDCEYTHRPLTDEECEKCGGEKKECNKLETQRNKNYGIKYFYSINSMQILGS